MKKNIFDPTAADEIIARARSLQAEAPRRWGSMTAHEMLHHCNTINRMNLDGKADHKKSTWKQHVLRLLMLHTFMPMPKNITTAGHQKPVLDATRFEAEQNRFVAIIREFSDRKAPIVVTHPVFGTLSRKEWGVFTWMHMDHHLRQFGV